MAPALASGDIAQTRDRLPQHAQSLQPRSVLLREQQLVAEDEVVLQRAGRAADRLVAGVEDDRVAQRVARMSGGSGAQAPVGLVEVQVKAFVELADKKEGS